MTGFDVSSGRPGQPSDDDLTAWSGKTAPSGAVVGTTDAQALTNKTLTAPTITSANISDSSLSFNGAKLQMFALDITNTGGTLQHRIIGERGTAVASAYADKIVAASASLTNTPSVDAVTPFAAGVGIDAASPSRVLLNTAAAQTNSKHASLVVVELNTTATSGLLANTRTVSSDVNGVTLNRLAIGLTTAAGAVHALSTANIGSGTTIRIRVLVLIE